jgi:hypothetical protein
MIPASPGRKTMKIIRSGCNWLPGTSHGCRIFHSIERKLAQRPERKVIRPA